MVIAASLVDSAARDHIVAVGRALRQQREKLSRSALEAILIRIPELDVDAPLVELLAASIDGNIAVMLTGLESGLTVGRFEPPVASYEHARRLAQRGIPVNALVRSYRLGQRHLLEAVYAECFAQPGAASTGAYEAIVVATFDYVDWISQRVLAVYEDEHRRWVSDRDTGLAARVDDVLNGTITEVDAVENAIRHRVRGSNLAAVVWVDDATSGADQLPHLTAAAAALSETIGSTADVLVVSRDAGSAWVWFSLHPSSSVDLPRCEAALLRAVTGVAPRVALGEAHRGIDGFRRTLSEALAAQRVAVVGHTRSAVISHDAPGLSVAALLSRNLEETREWVVSTLRDLARDDEAHDRLRETLRELLRHEGSYMAAGEAMQLHRNSVRYRVQTAERAMGRSLHDDRQSIELALTACEWLGAAVLSPVAQPA